MPSFKERFRPSRKYKKGKETSTSNTDESGIVTGGTPSNIVNIPSTGAAPVSTTSSLPATLPSTTSTTIDDHTGSAALATYYSHYSSDHCE